MTSRLTESKSVISPTTSAGETAAALQSEAWGTILTDKCGRCDVRMKDDTGTPVNWIHPDLAKRLKLVLEKCDDRRFKDFNGKGFKAKEFVQVSWLGRRDNYTYYEVLYVAPKQSDIDVVLGEEFVDKHGRAREVCRSEPRTRPTRLFVRDEKLKEEKKEIAANREKNEREAEEAARAKENKKREKSDKEKVQKESGKR